MSIENKIKQREALENLYGNFVEPHINRLIEVNSQPLANNPVALPCFCFTSVWLLVTLLYCRWMRWRKAN